MNKFIKEIYPCLENKYILACALIWQIFADTENHILCETFGIHFMHLFFKPVIFFELECEIVTKGNFVVTFVSAFQHLISMGYFWQQLSHKILSFLLNFIYVYYYYYYCNSL